MDWRRPRAPCGRALRGLVLALGLGLAGCSWQTLLWRAGIPWWTTPSQVAAVAEHDGYLEAELVSEAFQLKLLFPANADCRSLLEPGAQVDYLKIGRLGSIRRDDARCDPVGVASLALWRDLRPRISGASPAPTAPAYFSRIYTDDEVVLLRGRFPLVYLIDWPGGADVIAIVPNTGSCQRPIESGAATMQFRQLGEPAFSLMSENGPCPIEGFALPQSAPADPAASERSPELAPGSAHRRSLVVTGRADR